MRISVLTSSRADYGIYLPLLRMLKEDNTIDLNIIAFGTHVSKAHGYTIDQIQNDGFEVGYKVDSINGDQPVDICVNMGSTISKFASVWEQEASKTDLIICLGDRYEMFAAVSASVPFNIPVAHIHGGETTLGAIDNAFRHAITMMSTYHFTSTASHQQKVVELTGNSSDVYNVGALSLDNLNNIDLLSIEDFKSQFEIDLSIPSILITFHPETVSFEKNKDFSKDLTAVFKTLNDFQLIITMPNADTLGSLIRAEFQKLAEEESNVICVENFGIKGYFSCMHHAQFLLGNTSSGIIEAASFQKYVINLGNRQKGREAGKNVFHIDINQNKIKEAIKKVAALGEFKGENIYKNDNSASEAIVEVLKTIA